MIDTRTREQKRQIMSLLDIGYDTEAGRYKGADTDATVAAAIGGGVMPGWVTELREEFFGPDGGNGEMESLASEVRGWLVNLRESRGKAERDLEAIGGKLNRIDDKIREGEGYLRRLEAIKRAVGPKAGAA